MLEQVTQSLDALRLSRAMTYKNALAGLNHGGGKAVIVADPTTKPVELLHASGRLVESLGGWDKLMETFKKRLEEQKGRHQGGKKWIGTAGTSPFGCSHHPRSRSSS